MRNILQVAKHELVSMLTKRSWWFFTFIFPLLILAFSIGPSFAASRSLGDISTALTNAVTEPLSYVDEAGILTAFPPEIPAGALRPFADRATAEAAVRAGTIELYYLLPADFLRTRQVWAIGDGVSFLAGGKAGLIEYLVNFNLTGDAGLATLLLDPTPRISGRGTEGGSTSNDLDASFWLPMGVMFVLFFVITMSAGYMLQSVAKEKENRTAEILLTSLRPRELMAGKVIGLGIVAVLQMAIWVGGAQLGLVSGLAGGAILGGAGDAVAGLAPLAGEGGTGATAGLLTQGLGAGGLPAIHLSFGFLGWALVFFALGYIVYASLLGAVGALAPNTREGSQFTFVLLLPLLVPLWLNQVFATDPNGPLATALSLFPLSAPSTMVTRLAVGGVPAWQPPLAALLTAVTAYLLVLLAARFFRSDTLLSAEALSWRKIGRELRGR